MIISLIKCANDNLNTFSTFSVYSGEHQRLCCQTLITFQNFGKFITGKKLKIQNKQNKRWKKMGLKTNGLK